MCWIGRFGRFEQTFNGGGDIPRRYNLRLASELVILGVAATCEETIAFGEFAV